MREEPEDDLDAATVAMGNDHLAPGTDVGGYILEGELGTGGMGVVYSATHPVIGKRAAIKILKPELSNNPAAVERFVMEARAVNQIGHPNIVDIFAFGTLPDGRSYYVMDLLAGESLRNRLERSGPLHVSEAASVIDEIASALIAAHDKGIIHRDLKPDNVFMVSAPGRWPEVRILDWGLLKLSSGQSAVASGRYRTLAGSVMGTPVYMSPEQARASDSVDFRSDIYSLGVMSYEILAGTVPFKKGSSIDTLLAHQEEPVPPLAQKCPGLPEELVQLIEAMLAKEPEGRPTLAAVRAVIKRLRASKIPTMTAAGLSMPQLPATPFVEPPTGSHPTLDDGPRKDAFGASMELTVPRPRDSFPLPPPPATPMAERPSFRMPQPSIDVRAPGGPMTLTGHVPPSASNPRQPVFRASGPSVPLGSQAVPPTYPRASAEHLPQQYHQQPPAPASSGNAARLIVILIVAAIASAVGIYLLLAS